MENKDKIIKVLADNKEGIKAGQIAEQTGIDKKEVDNVLKQLKKEELIVSPKRCFWTTK